MTLNVLFQTKTVKHPPSLYILFNCLIVTDRFTQMVWKDSLELGVGFVPTKEPGNGIIVCFYYPAGNVKGKFLENVLPPMKQDEESKETTNPQSI